MIKTTDKTPTNSDHVCSGVTWLTIANKLNNKTTTIKPSLKGVYTTGFESISVQKNLKCHYSNCHVTVCAIKNLFNLLQLLFYTIIMTHEKHSYFIDVPIHSSSTG